MQLNLPFSFNRIFFLLLFIAGSQFSGAQTTVFSDDYATSAGTTYTTATGAVGTSAKWSLTRSSADFGAKIDAGQLTLTNDATASGNNNGWVLASANAAFFSTPYNTTLASNPGMVTWSFNMRQLRTNPRGFGASNFGVAYILAGTSGTTNVTGTGYAVILGNSGGVDPIKLVRYTSGIRTNTVLLNSTTSGLTDFGNEYLSVKVTYIPTTNTWQLYLRNDGASAFQDPAAGVLTSQGTVVNSTSTATPLPIMGCYWNGSTTGGQTAFFDNVKVGVTGPVITSLSPSSKTAGSGVFTITVNGANFVSGSSTVRWNGSNRTTTYVSATQLTATIAAADIASSGTAAITVANGAAISNSQTFTIDLAGVPSLTLSTNALGSVSTVTGTASTALTYTISGANLTADPVVTAPANFEVSKDGTTYSNSLTLARSGNFLTPATVTLYSRIKTSAPAGIYSANIDHTTIGGTTRQVAVSGIVLASQPTTQSTAVTFTNVTSASFTLSWTNGNGSSRLVLLRSGSAVNAAAVDGVSYTGITSYGTGSEIGTGNFVVYSGTGNSVNVTGLSPATTYHVAVYEFNGSGGTENYLTTSPATGNRTMLNAPIGWQIYTANAVNTINFDTTVDGVNMNAFQGDGLAPNSESGALNSNAWAISGFSDGNIAFGGTYTEDQDYDRGPSDADVDVGGVYGFETSPNNFSLGIQPATGDFAPGTVTLRFQNQTGAAVTSINIGYKVYVYNDEPASSSFNFSYSGDNSTYTAVSGLNIISPAVADAAPGWKAYYRVVTLTGLNIANNNYYYLRWSGATVSGAANFDEFALDDIVMVANPSTTFVPFSGTADTFAVLGNTSLSGDLTVATDLTLNGGKVDIGSNTLTLNGTITNTAAGGLKGSASSNLVVSGAISPSLSFDQTTLGTTNLLNNLNINTTAGNTVVISNPVVINGTLETAVGQSLNLGTNALTGTLSTINNNGTILTQNTTATPLPSGKTWGGRGTVNYNASTAQTVVTGTYQGLSITNTAGATAAGSFTVNGILNLPFPNPSATAGSLSMGTYTVTMGGSATNTGTGDVTGIITRNSIVANTLYTFGHPDTSIIFPTAGTLPTSMSLKIVIGTIPAWRAGAIKRTYDFIQSGASATKAVIKAHYLDSELNGNNETKLVDWSYIVSSSTTLEQGRSNYNTTENWIELTNVNVGLYFAPVFDAVRLTLDESEAGSLIWNGSVSTSWTTATNWTPNATPSDNTTVYIPDAATTPNDPTLNPAVLLGALNIDAGGILNSGANSQFTLNGGAGAWINNGTFNPDTSTVIFTNADATIAGSSDFNNITINSGAGLRPLTGNIMRVSGAFVNNGTLSTGVIENYVYFSGTNQIIPSPNGGISAFHNLIINGTGAIFPTSLNITGNLTLNQTVNFSGKTVVMTGTGPQSIGGSSVPVFNNLAINNLYGEVNLAVNTTVNGTLTLTAGNLNIGNNNLTLGTNPVSGSFGPTKMIITGGTGEVKTPFASAGSYLFPIGEASGTTEYSPITVSVTSGSFTGAYVGVSVADAIHTDNHSTENNISRYWNVSQSGITGAVATITATYLPSDLTGTESTISAGQLKGAFSQQTNPWIKYAAANSNTLTAASASLTAGQPSIFTGIKGSVFSVVLSGYGSFCQNEAVTLSAIPTNGDGPYTYFWSAGLGTGETAVPPTSVVGSANYTVTAKDANGITVSDNNNVVVLPPSVGGTVTTDQTICPGSRPADLTLSGYTGDITYWQSASDIAFTTPVNISNTTAVLTGAAIGPVSVTTYFRAVVKSGSCTRVFSAPAAIIIKSTTWNGVAWSNGAPDSVTSAFITGNYTATGNLNACTLTISNNAVVDIPAAYDVTLNGALAVDSGSFTLENNANLLQLTDVANSGNIIVKRNSSALKRQDYTLWSSPVAGQNVLGFSPFTLTNRFYTYNTDTNLYNAVADPSAVTFSDAKGYLVRMPNNHPTWASVWNGQFTGVPHNGNYNFTMYNGGAGKRFNLVGNPYPSPISMNTFVSNNAGNITGTLYFWRKTNNATSPSYCSWTAGGGFVTNGEAQVSNPNGIIRTGQGFFVEAAGNATTVSFNNGQRSGDNANQFFRTDNEPERNRIWLNATNDAGAFSQMLVGYITDATMGVDDQIDGKYINDGVIALNSIIDNTDYVIQGRPLPFDASDIVPLKFTAATAGNYTIAIDHVDGFFTGSQDIFLKDNLSGVTHDLKGGAYTFASEAGTSAGRFEIVYQNLLEVNDPGFDENGMVIYKHEGSFVINSGSAIMDTVRVYDVRGRLLLEKKAVNASETTFDAGETNQVLIVKITSDSDATVTKKVIN